MNEVLTLPAEEYESLSEQMELESLRYSRALPEEEEARPR